MIATELWLDGNAVAGVLAAALRTEMTDAPRRCQSCGQIHQIGEHRLYRGAGLVLRCPNCGDVAARIASLPGRYILALDGAWQFEINVTRPTE